MNRLSKLVIFIFLLILTNLSLAETTKPSKIEILSDVAKALGDLGESIVKITNGIKHVVVTGEEGVSYVLAKKTQSELKELSARSTQFAASQNIRVIESIDEYLQYPNPRNWLFVRAKLENVLSRGSELLSEWNKERSDFIVETSYARLIESLNSRLNILQKLSNMEAPTTEEELKALKQVNEEYLKLVDVFKQAIQELNTYIKNGNV